MQKHIYLDNAATTMVYPEVRKTISQFLEREYGNPSSNHLLGYNAHNAIQKAKTQISQVLNCDNNEIYFTSGGTEADNWALKGIAEYHKNKGNHIITSCIEHSAIYNTCKFLENQGYEVTYLPVNREGFINLNKLRHSIKPETILISIMYANNEIGTIQPIEEIGRIAKENNIIFHTDAVQAFGHCKIDVQDLNIDLLSFSGHKIHAPKGVGGLFIRKEIGITPLIHGGHQQNQLRSGTENVASIVGMGQATEIIYTNFKEKQDHVQYLKERLMYQLNYIPNVYVNGSIKYRLTNNLNCQFKDVDGQYLIHKLNEEGIYVSSGSACNSLAIEPSRVLTSIGLTDKSANESIRFSLSEFTTKEEIDYTVEKLKEIVAKYRIWKQGESKM